jgi:amidase
MPTRPSRFDVVALDWDGMELGGQAFIGIFFSEAWDVDHALVAESTDTVSDDTKQAIAFADTVRGRVAEARRLRQALRASLSTLFDQVELLALPTLPTFPPRLDELSSESLFDTCMQLVPHVAPFNVAGVPCTAQPVPVHGSRIPASLQLVGPHGGEELLLATAATVEASAQ